MSQDENVEEVLFVLNGSIYMLLHPNFGSFSVLQMFKWNGNRFEHAQVFQVVFSIYYFSTNKVLISEDDHFIETCLCYSQSLENQNINYLVV